MKFKQRFSSFLDQISKHEVFILSSSIAYTTGLALAPFVLILLSLATLFGDATRDKIFAGFSDVVGQQASGSIKMIVENAEKNPQGTGISGAIGFIVLLVSASAIFSQLRYALDKINEHKATEKEQGMMGFVKDRFLSMGLLLGFVFLTITSMILTTTLTLVLPEQDGWFWQSLVFVITLMVFSLLFTAIYRFVPTDKASWKRCAVAGVTSAVFFNIGKTLIGLYLGTAGLEKSYGAAGSIVVFLAWVYYSGLTLLVSYEFANGVLLRVPPHTKIVRSTPRSKESRNQITLNTN
ncbi:YihY/virulence factor BrkB family protein [Bdellovibrio bacteriovorus]|uniref:RNase BN n=1 Tax=Bdellovibrio bacteriovorus str. Tiberius TaxID=1069642 RepID=K7ZEK8_BDEBC|nr:YihY/virulence factor BrkB family protein [Bdellovibrio bacteriovorus]AFY00582.1 RNase BN [Bdellovibrio bacteriovorus str. Tiberius]